MKQDGSATMKIRSSTTRSTIFEMEVPNYENRKTSEKGDFREMLRICSHWKIAKTNPNVNEDPNFSLMFAVIKVTLDVLRIHLLLSQSLSLLHESNLFTDLKSIRNMPDQNIFSDLSMASPLHPSVVGFFFFLGTVPLSFLYSCVPHHFRRKWEAVVTLEYLVFT